jgi:hypothetical protein
MESLERRSLLATLASGGFQGAPVAHETLDQALQIGDLTTLPATVVAGSIGDGPCGAADVDWYGFTLDRPMQVDLALGPGLQRGAFRGVLSLYDNDPLDFQDPYNPDGYRLLEQQGGASSTGAAIDRLLGPGTYELAVSGAGNADFHPLVAGSGYSGDTGGFLLQVTATVAGPGPGDGPAVLTADPAAGAVLSSSPFEIRLDLSAALDPATILPGQNVQLTYNPSGNFGDGSDQPVALSPYNPVNFSSAANELQISPQAPLAPGYYKVTLAGDSDTSAGQPVLAAPDAGPALGTDSAHPDGQDFSYVFQVGGIDGNTGPGAASDDTPASAHNLGDVTSAGLVQASGAIGVDPYYNPASSDPSNNNPADQVDLYHIQISGAGTHALLAEVFAGRINSPLDPGVSLYQRLPGDPTLHFVAGNNNTYDPVPTTNGQEMPFFSDAFLSVGLTAGDYYLAVASGSNTPSPLENLPPGTSGLFDPNVSHSGQLGSTTGPYVLNLLVTEPTAAPHVVTTSPADGASLPQSPTALTVQFDRTVNIAQLAFQTFQQTSQDTVSAVYVEAMDGTKYFPRFQSYDPTSDQAAFLMLDRLPAGTYELHLSGAQGLADLAGNPLAGNSSGGDDVTTFTVLPGGLVPSGDPVAGYTVAAQADAARLQDLGTLFPHELQAGVTVTRDDSQDPDLAPADTSESYRFQVLQDETYTFNLSGANLKGGVALTLTDAQGQSPSLVPLDNGQALFGDLAPGTYTISVGDWSAAESAAVAYQLAITFTSTNENAPPLVSGPAPALQVMLSSLPGPSTGAAPETPVTVSPAASSPAGGVGNLDPGSSSSTVAFVAPSFVSAATGPLAATVPADAPASISGPSTLSDLAATSVAHGPSSASPIAFTSAALLVLSVSPVGSLGGSAPASAPAAVPVAFALPSQPPTAPALGEALVSLLTTIQVLGLEPATSPEGSTAGGPGIGGDPAVVFDEALLRVAESAPIAPGGAVTVATLDPAPDDLAGALEGPVAAAGDSPRLSAERTDQDRSDDEVLAGFPVSVRLADLAWGATVGCIAATALILVRRHAGTRTDGRAPAGLHRATGDSTDRAEPEPSFARRRGGGLRRALWRKSPRRSAARATQRGCSS